MRILIIDDHEDNRLYMQTLADIDGHDVVIHDDAATAIEVGREIDPDIIVLDVVLPGELNGFDIAQQIRADDQLSDVAILATTAAVEMYTEKMALKAGCDGYLAKPFRRQQWQDALKEITGIESN